MNPALKIITPGFYTSIQDAGRADFTKYGVPESGAMDQKSFSMANALLNNIEDAATLEITLKGPTIEFIQNTHFVLTGAPVACKLDDTFIIMNKVYLGLKGQKLDIGKVIKGCRSYLAIEGGIQNTPYLRSRSQYHPITPLATIVKNQTIYAGPSNYGSTKNSRLQIKENLLFDHAKIQVEKGPEYHLLGEKIKSELHNNSFKIASFNRMGVFLDKRVENELAAIMTGPVIPGTIQLTPSGKLIVLLRDCQLTGGYPRILQLTENAINVISQKKTGDIIHLSF